MNFFHVTVAYDSPEELEVLLTNIGSQDEQQHKIICIDNSNPEVKETNRLICEKFNQGGDYFINYYKTVKNIGSAGGFALGMKLATDAGADWIWLHDQDGYPRPGCLGNLKRFLTDEGGIYTPLVLDETGTRLSIFHGYYNKHWNFKTTDIENDLTQTDVAGSAGLLVSRNVIETIGLYDYFHYFLGFEDYDFCLKAKGKGFKINIIKDAVYFHPDKWSHVILNEKDQFFQYFGAISKSAYHKSISGLNYNIIHARQNFLLNYMYSLIKASIKKIYVSDIALAVTLRCYLSALWSRYFENNLKVTIDPGNYLS